MKATLRRVPVEGVEILGAGIGREERRIVGG
jgi:hypothetical protein